MSPAAEILCTNQIHYLMPTYNKHDDNGTAWKYDLIQPNRRINLLLVCWFIVIHVINAAYSVVCSRRFISHPNSNPFTMLQSVFLQWHLRHADLSISAWHVDRGDIPSIRKVSLPYTFGSLSNVGLFLYIIVQSSYIITI